MIKAKKITTKCFVSGFELMVFHDSKFPAAIGSKVESTTPRKFLNVLKGESVIKMGHFSF